MNATWKAVLGVIGIFVLGWLAGVLSTSLYIGHRVMSVYRGGPAAMEQIVEKRLLRGVNLEAGQKEKIHGYFMDNVNQRIELQKQIQPQIQTLNQQTFEQISAVLLPEQAEKFHANLEYFRLHAGRGFFNPAAAEQPATNQAAGTPPGK